MWLPTLAKTLIQNLSVLAKSGKKVMHTNGSFNKILFKFKKKKKKKEPGKYFDRLKSELYTALQPNYWKGKYKAGKSCVKHEFLEEKNVFCDTWKTIISIN